MSAGIEIRLIRPEDDPEVYGRIVQDAYFSLPDYPRDPEGYDLVLAEVAQRAVEADVLVGLVDGRPAGCLTFVPDHTNVHAEHDDVDAACIRLFGIAPTAQGRGLGEAMVQWCIDRARSMGRRRVRLHTLTMMHGAQRLYERLGFVREPEQDESWDGVVGWAYRLDL